MITWEQLRDLAAFRAQHGSAVSLYMGLDPSIVPTAGDLASHTRSMLARAERQLDERRTFSHDERKALALDLERIETWFASEFRREGVRGVAVFAARLDDLFLPLLTLYIKLALLAGGVGNNRGAVLGAVVVVTFLESTRFVVPLIPGLTHVQGAALREFLISAALIVVLRLRPQGLLPEARMHPVLAKEQSTART